MSVMLGCSPKELTNWVERLRKQFAPDLSIDTMGLGIIMANRMIEKIKSPQQERKIK